MSIRARSFGPLLAALVACAAFGAAPSARAQTQDLDAARQLFQEALADEKAQAYGTALEKYRRVQAVKDTANVRFRIGACQEGLGRLRAALASYDGAIHLGRGEPASRDVVAEAEKRIEALTPRMGRIALAGRSPGTTIRIDGEELSEADLAGPVWIDAGEHTIVAEAPGKKARRTTVVVREKDTITVDASLEEDVSPPPRPSPPPPKEGPARVLTGVALVSLGGLLAVATGVCLGVREATIGDLNAACPGGVCPASRAQELTSMRDRALALGPGAAVLGIAAGVGAVTGVVLLLWTPSAKPVAVSPWIGPGHAGLHFGGTFR
jgi:tetratricopeptide (TPR) repeat protein